MSIGKLVKSVSTRFVETVMCMSRPTPKSCVRELFSIELFLQAPASEVRWRFGERFYE